MSQSIKLRHLIANRKYFQPRLKGIRKTLAVLSASDKKFNTMLYPAFFQDQAKKYAHRTLIKYEDAVISYGEFNEASNRIAHFLSSENIGKGDTVALLMENRPEFLLYKLAIVKTGASAALINNSQKGATLIHSIDLVNAKAAIVGEERLEAFNAVKGELKKPLSPYIVPDINTLSETGDEFSDGQNIVLASKDCSSENPETVKSIVADDPAWYIYTSGTTGLPKASLQNHRRVVKAISSMGNIINPLKQDDVVFSSLPLYHITSLSVCWFAAIYNGAAFALSRKFSASRFWGDVHKYQATSFGYVGELCRYLLNQPESPDDKYNSIRSMTGNGLRPEIWKEFKQRFGIEQVNEIYGASEGNLLTCNVFNLDCTVGMALSAHAIVEVDEETEEPIRDTRGRLKKVKPGEPGLLLGKITKALPFDGYSDKAKNETKILRNAFKKGDAWFNTGDVLRDIGMRQLQFCDRTGDTFRWKGENVSTQEVENVCNAFDTISESVAYGVEIPGTNGKAGMVAIKLEDGAELDQTSFLNHLKSELPNYAIPVFLRFKDELEKTETFKYQKTGLKKDAFDISATDDAIWVYLPGSDGFVPLDSAINQKIAAGEYRF